MAEMEDNDQKELHLHHPLCSFQMTVHILYLSASDKCSGNLCPLMLSTYALCNKCFERL